MLCCSGETKKRTKTVLFYTLSEVSAKRLSSLQGEGGIAKDNQARRLIKKTREGIGMNGEITTKKGLN